jgi:hypothetical protein
MKKTYETPQIIVTAFESESIMSLVTSSVAPTKAKKSSSNTISFGSLK